MGVGELLLIFDKMRVEHEGMAPERFNDDGIYKGGINLVMWAHKDCVGAVRVAT